MFDIKPSLTKLDQQFGRSYSANTVIFHEGEPGDEVFFILTGQVQISTIYNKNFHSEHIMTVLSETDIFGELAVLDDTVRSATAKTLTDVRVIVFEKEQFLNFIPKYPQLTQKLIQRIGDYIRRQENKLAKVLKMLENKL